MTFDSSIVRTVNSDSPEPRNVVPKQRAAGP